jgi:hypothetical protein
MGSIAAQVPAEVELAARVGLLLLVVGCISTPDLGGGGPPRSSRRPPPHEINQTECDHLGGDWVAIPAIAVGGICRLEPPPPPPVLHLCGDAGADAAPLGFCTHDAGADSPARPPG